MEPGSLGHTSASAVPSLSPAESTLSPAVLPGVVEAHKYRLVRALIPVIMAVLGVHLCCTFLPLRGSSEHETRMRMASSAVHISGLAIYGYVCTIADDVKAHRLVVWLNEINCIVTACCAPVYLHWHHFNGTISSITVSDWAFAQLCGTFVLIAFTTNMLCFPLANRKRLYAVCALALMVEPTFSPIPQPLQGLILVAAGAVGELLGRFCCNALLAVYRDQEMAYQMEKARLCEQLNLATHHSFEVENQRREQLIRERRSASEKRLGRRHQFGMLRAQAEE